MGSLWLSTSLLLSGVRTEMEKLGAMWEMVLLCSRWLMLFAARSMDNRLEIWLIIPKPVG